MAYTKAVIPSGFVAPSNPICIQCRVNPTEIYAKDKIKESDYLAPQYTLAFTVATNPAVRGIKPNAHSAKRKRDGDVQNIITNFYGIQTRKPIPSLRCLGVTFGSVLDVKGAKTHPDSIGRLAVIVSGAVTIVCNQNDLANLHVGDLLTWALSDNGQCYEGYPNDWSTAKIVRATPPSIMDIDMSFESVFGPKKAYDTTDEADLKSQLGTLQTIAPTSILDVTHLAGVTPYAVAETLAYIMFAEEGITLQSRDEWIDRLYNPESDYYCFETKPTEKTSIKWMQHCLGDARGQWLVDNTVNPPTQYCKGSRVDVYDKSTQTIISNSRVADGNALFDHLPPAVGWFVARKDSKNSANQAKMAELSRVAKMTALPAQTNFKEYLLYKAIHGEPFTSHDWAMFVLGHTPAAKDVGTFTSGIFAGGTTHRRMAAMVFLDQDYMNRITTLAYNDKEDTNPADLARVGYDFYNVDPTIATAVKTIAGATQTASATPEMKTKYAETVLGMHIPTHNQNVFGMLLEKNQRANEARILLRV